MKNNRKQDFVKWLDGQGIASSDIARIVSAIEEASAVALNRGIIADSFWNVDNEIDFSITSAKLMTMRSFQLTHKSLVTELVPAISLYSKFLDEVEKHIPDNRIETADDRIKETIEHIDRVPEPSAVKMDQLQSAKNDTIKQKEKEVSKPISKPNNAKKNQNTIFGIIALIVLAIIVYTNKEFLLKSINDLINPAIFIFQEEVTSPSYPYEKMKDGLTYTVYENYASVIDCDKNVVTVEIPSMIEGKTVTTIGPSAFKGCSTLNNVTIPDSVTSIGGGAFDGCSFLTSIIIPEGVTSIEGGTFLNCNTLMSVSAKGVTSIEDLAFMKCQSLVTLLLSDKLTELGLAAFCGCSSLKSINIPSGITIIKRGTFDGCSSLTDVSIPEGVTSIEMQAFSDCRSLSRISLPESLNSIEGNSFPRCSSLTVISIPKNVKRIGGAAFAECSSLKGISIPRGVTSIEGSTFSRCSSLRTVSIPNSVTSIGDYAFFGCDSLTEVFYDGSMAQWNGIEMGEHAFPGKPNFQYNT